MNALLLSMLFVPAAPVPKGGDPDLAAAQKLLVDYSERPRARVGAVMLMGRLRSPAAIPEVRACLKDPDRRLREMAVAALVDLDAIDDACLKALDELEEELAAITDGSDTRFFFQHIFYAAERHPTHAAKLVPFIHRQYAAQSPDVRMGELVRLRERFACAVPGLLDKIAQHLKAIDPAKATQEDHFEVLSFAKAMRRAVDPSKAAVEELDRWWSTDKFGIDLEIAETLLRLDPKNKRAPQILEYNIDRFEAATSDHAVRMAKFLPLVRSHPALFSKMGKLAFTPGIGDNARPMFWAIGRRGEACWPASVRPHGNSPPLS